MGITQEYAERRFDPGSLEYYETREFREYYIPDHLDYEENNEPRVLWYLIKQGYLREPYFDWATRTVTQ